MTSNNLPWWELANSPLVLTVISVLIGGLLASLLAARYQRKSQLFQIRVETMRRLMEQFVRWGDAFHPPNAVLIVDRLAELKPTLQFVPVVFPDNAVTSAVDDVLHAVVARSRQPLPQNPNQLQALRDAAYDKFRVMIGILAAKVGVPK